RPRAAGGRWPLVSCGRLGVAGLGESGHPAPRAVQCRRRALTGPYLPRVAARRDPFAPFVACGALPLGGALGADVFRNACLVTRAHRTAIRLYENVHEAEQDPGTAEGQAGEQADTER